MIGCAIIYIFVVKLDFARANWKTKYQIVNKQQFVMVKAELVKANNIIESIFAYTSKHLNYTQVESKEKKHIEIGLPLISTFLMLFISLTTK